MPKLSKTKGNDNNALPPIANKTANSNDIKIILILKKFETFLVDTFEIYLNNK